MPSNLLLSKGHKARKASDPAKAQCLVDHPIDLLEELLGTMLNSKNIDHRRFAVRPNRNGRAG